MPASLVETGIIFLSSYTANGEVKEITSLPTQ